MMKADRFERPEAADERSHERSGVPVGESEESFRLPFGAKGATI